MHQAEDTTTVQLTRMLRSADAKLSHELLIASEKGKKHAAYLLLHQGIDKERCKGMSGYTPLHYGATRGHLEVIQLLLDFGWPIDTRNDALETPLHLAAFNGHTAVAECLLDRGATINACNEDNETPLFYAARKHHHRVVRLLIRRECDLGLQNRFGDTAQDEAANEKTLMEFAVGNEDAQRLYSLKRATHLTQPHWNDDNRSSSETLLAQKLRERVLMFLDLKSLCLASQVAYRWHRAADNPTLWRKLGVSRWELLLNATMGMGTHPESKAIELRPW
uniref:F-box domain-containing protein n=1 Tax=Globisporangium ultimum (strain ATCC 200006 / CBS 805.95 / DAOM BR144) TaxID=431595 RepID=K3WSQ2_GLOUD